MAAFERYRVSRVIQEGEHAELFAAFGVGSRGDERVVLKRLRAESVHEVGFIEAFAAEAEIAFRRVLPGVVRIVDYGLIDELPFLAMEHVDGADLAGLCERLGTAGRPLPADVALALTGEVARVLAAVHNARLLHRDVREESVLITWDGRVVLGEPVMARARRRAEAPAVVLERPELDYDPAIDVRALGAMLLRMLWLDTSSVAPPDALVIVRRAAQEARDRWYASAAEMAEDIFSLLARRQVVSSASLIADWIGVARPSVQPDTSDLFAAEFIEGGELWFSDGRKLCRFRSVVADQLLFSPGELALGGSITGTTGEQPVVKAPRDPFLGTTLAGFELVEMLGRGSVARVYRGREHSSGTELAVKVLDGKAMRYEVSAKRMVREASVLRDLRHPNLVEVYDSGFTEEGHPFLILELLNGATLRDLMSRRGRPYSLPDVAEIVTQIAYGLAAAHARGLVHRDLKPSNVMLLDDQDSLRIKILDFGLARVFSGAEASGSTGGTLTGANAFVGTPKYIAPEQILGASLVGPAADLYSLGVILYEMLAGEPPFQGKMAEILQGHLHQQPEPLPECGGLEVIAAELLVKDPEKRLANASELIARVEALGLRHEEEPDLRFEAPTDLDLKPPPMVAPSSVGAAAVGGAAVGVGAAAGGAVAVAPRPAPVLEPPAAPMAPVMPLQTSISSPPEVQRTSPMAYFAVIALALATAALAFFLLRG